MDSATFAALSQEEQIGRIESLGRAALAEFGIQPLSITPLVHAENTTYKVTAEAGTFCLRVCRPGYQSDSNVASEIVFCSAMRNAGFDVPQPYQERVVKVGHPDVPEARNCVLLHWQEGEFSREGFSPAQASDLGRTMATFHAFSASWTPPAGFDRNHNPTELFSSHSLLVESPTAYIEEENRLLLVDVLKQSRELLTRISRDSSNFGLIHGDMHTGNVLFDGSRIRIIDFDDTGWAYWLTDFAAALAYEVGKPSFPAVRDAMLDGYAEIRPLPPGADRLLPKFIKLRFLTISEWALNRMDNPRMRETGGRWIAMLCDGIRALG